MKKTILGISAALALTAFPSVSFAELAFNVGVVSDYRFRGISQTREKVAVQGGVDFSRDGFYVGAWASNIKWIDDLGGDASAEIDLYGGYKGELPDGSTWDVGVLTYQYPGNKLDPSANTTELYGAITTGPATLKYSQSVTDTFGNADSKNSWYLDLSASFVVGDVTVVPHIGYQRINGPLRAQATYTDYSLTASRTFSGVVVSVGVVGTNADSSFYSSPVNGKDLGKATLVVGAKYSF